MFALSLKKSCEKVFGSDLFELSVVENSTGEVRLLTENSYSAQLDEFLLKNSSFRLVLGYDAIGGFAGFCGERQIDSFCCELNIESNGSGDFFPTGYKISSDDINADDALDYFGKLISIVDTSENKEVVYS